MQPGACASLPIAADGSAVGPVHLLADLRHNAHFIATDPTNRFAFLPGLLTQEGGQLGGHSWHRGSFPSFHCNCMRSNGLYLQMAPFVADC